MERITCLALGIFLTCGGIAGVLATDLVPAGLADLTARHLEKKPYVVTRPSDNLVEVSEDKWFLVPILIEIIASLESWKVYYINSRVK